MIVQETYSLCKDCLEIIPAKLEDRGELWLRKECDRHGVQETKIEKSLEVWNNLHDLQNPEPYHHRFDVCMIPVTDRCNIRCPHCYHIPGSQPDPTINDVLDLVGMTRSDQDIILMGAEPTVRTDLHKIVLRVSGTGRRTYLYTNGIRLSNIDLIHKLKMARLGAICLSLHTPEYTPGWQKKITALELLRKSEICVDHISFTMRTLGDLEIILPLIKTYIDLPHHFRIRVPSRIGICHDSSFFMSEFLSYLSSFAQKKHLEIEKIPADNNAYHIMFRIDGALCRLIRWPSIDEVAFSELDCPPTCLFIPELGELNFIHGALIQEAMKTRNIKLPSETKKMIGSVLSRRAKSFV